VNAILSDPGYRKYIVAWGVLLLITLVMLAIHDPGILMAGIVLKAGIICLWFMHLAYERIGLVLAVLLGLFGTGAVLFVLLLPDCLSRLK